MNLFKIANKKAFIDEIANYAMENFSNDLSKLKIILPTGYLCSHLQEFLTSKLSTAILPNIIPISEITTETEESFKIPSYEIQSISKLQERIVLAGIVHTYPKLDYNIIQSLRLSSQLANLFYELETNEINVEKLKDIPSLDQSLHWNSIYEFLIFSNKNWQTELKKIGKLSRSRHQKLMFDSEVARLKENTDESILIAGITADIIQTIDFIKQIISLPNGHLILPPIDDADLMLQILPEQALFNIYKLISSIGRKPIDFKTLGTTTSNILSILIGGKHSETLANTISYLEFDNIFDEATYISDLAKNILIRNSDAKIAIVINNIDTKDIYTNHLEKYGINYHDLIGVDLLQINHISLILSISELLCDDFTLKKLFNLLSNPLLDQPIAIKIKNILVKENRFAASFIEVERIIHNSLDQELKDWINIIFLLFKQTNKEFEKNLKNTEELKDSTNIRLKESLALDNEIFANNVKLTKVNTFNDILVHVIQIAEKLCPSIWQQSSQYNLSNAISEIIAENWDFEIEKIQEFPDILKGIIGGGRIFHQSANTHELRNVLLCRASDAAFINFDHMIIADFSDGNYPLSAKNSPWMNRHMQEKLGLYTERAKYGNSLYEFYLLLNNTNVILTRSKKQVTNKLLSKSHFLLRLETILGNKLNKSIGKVEEPIIASLLDKEFVIADFFPNQISATDIEMLIRSPYNFYAKKILKLKSLNNVEDSPKLAEFGNFFHKVAEQYTLNYNLAEHNKNLTFIRVAENILSQSLLPDYSKKHWYTKLEALSNDFIMFDEARRKSLISVHSELKGTLALKINGIEIKIIAIADRIEINKNGKATILDYKTGAIPTKKDVLSGLSPQLIVEALIMMEDGFGLGKLEIDQLVYVKIGNTVPYITTTEISITKSDLLSHREGLVALLEHYILTKKFPIEPNLMRYDDYKHFSRR